MQGLLIAEQLAPLLGVDAPRAVLLRLGKIQNKHRRRLQLTAAEQTALEIAHESSTGEGSTRGIILAYAEQAYALDLQQQVQQHGGTIFTERYRVSRDGARLSARFDGSAGGRRGSRRTPGFVGHDEPLPAVARSAPPRPAGTAPRTVIPSLPGLATR